MKKAELEKITKIATKTALEAGDILMKFYRKKIAVSEKVAAGLVTKADLTSEAHIKKVFKKHFPSFSFLGEESGESFRADDQTPVWHVDPLDGTTNFVHGFPMFCVSIGLSLGNTPILGVIHIPTIKETFYGSKGNGAFLNKKRIRVSKRANLSECLLTTGFAYIHQEEKLKPEIERFKKISLAARAVRRPGAAAIDLAYVAAGVFDGFWEKNLSSWDVCAGSLLVREAGGLVTDFAGTEFKLPLKEIVACNSLIHGQVISHLS